MSSFDNQTQTADEITVQGMATNLGINVAISLGVLMLFNLLRPKNNLVYAPKFKYSSDKKQPPKVGNGFFDWVTPVLHTGDSELIEKIGFDAIMFVRFVRLCRRLVIVMCIIGVCVLIPVNVLGTKYTATSKNKHWPPSVDHVLLVISMSQIDGKIEPRWLWGHVCATWVFSLAMFFYLLLGYREHVRLRQQYFSSDDYQNQLHSRTIMVMNVPENKQADDRLGSWFETLRPRHPILQALIGRKADKLQELMEKHEKLIHELEGSLASFLKDGKNVRDGKRPKHTIGGFLGCCGRKVDAIDHFTRQIEEIEAEIERERGQISKYKPTNYGFVSFQQVDWAHAVSRQLQSGLPMQFKSKSADPPIIKLAPHPKDIIWSNVGMNTHLRNTRRLIGNVVFVAFAFLWIIPLTALSAAAQIKNIIGIFPAAKPFFKRNTALAGLIEALFSPIIMAIFFLILPKLFRFLSKQQGTLTRSSLDRQVLSKLYIFFIINNLLYFSISQFIVGVYGKIRSDIEAGQATTDSIWADINTVNTINRLGQTLIDVSNYWINYVSLRGLTLILDLAQVVSLFIIWIRKTFTNPTPRQLREFTRPPDFEYATYYNIHLFVFTIVLIYSVISPIILIFGLVYFLLTTLVFRYQLMYVFATAIETGGAMWRVIFNRILVSAVIFQVVMTAALNIRGTRVQLLVVAPLPLITFIFKVFMAKMYDPKCYYYDPKLQESGHSTRAHHTSVKDKLGARFGNPVFFAELASPMVHANIKHLLGKAYHQPSTRVQNLEVTSSNRHSHPKHMGVISGVGLKFQAIDEKELEYDDSSEGINAAYRFDDQDSIADSGFSTPAMDPSRGTPHQGYSRAPTPGSLSQPLPPNQESMNHFIAGRSYAHNASPRPELIEMARVHTLNNYPSDQTRTPPPPPPPPPQSVSPAFSQATSYNSWQSPETMPRPAQHQQYYDYPQYRSPPQQSTTLPQEMPMPTMTYTEAPREYGNTPAVMERPGRLGVPQGGEEERYSYTGVGGQWDRENYGGGYFKQ